MSVEVFTCLQGTPEWRECRRGIPTASAFHMMLAGGQGKTRRKYMLELIGEQLTGLPADSFANAHTERGHIMEVEARERLAYDYELPLRQVGFLRREIKGAGYVGCSPDSLIGDDGMIEIKTKLPHLQLEVLLEKRLPPEHVAQCQGALWVAQRKWLDFVSYWPGLADFKIRVFPDPEYFAKLEEGVARFYQEMQECIKQIPPAPTIILPRRPTQILAATEFTNLDH
jgi:hypothetical protein